MKILGKTLGVSVLWALGAVGCGHEICDPRASPCPNDPQTSQAAVDQCRARESMNPNDACRTAAHTLANCGYNAVVCTSGGRTDPGPTFNNLTSNCAEETNALARCCIDNPRSVYCGGSGP